LRRRDNAADGFTV